MQDLERFEHQVEDMYNILLNISSELLTIKSLMKANRSKLNENDNKTEGKKYSQCYIVHNIRRMSTKVEIFSKPSPTHILKIYFLAKTRPLIG